MNIILEEGEMICPICNGTGNDKENVFVCEKCDGNKKVDWVSNVISQNKEMTSLDMINVRRLIANLKLVVDKSRYEPVNNLTMDTLKTMMGNYLTTLKDKKVIDDYEITKAFCRRI